MRRTRKWTRVVGHAVAWLPLAWLLIEAGLGRLSPNPIQDWTQRTGRGALYLLTLSLAATPLSWLPGLKGIRPWRRTWGLYAFAYAVLHVYLFVGVDYGWRWDWLWQEILTQKPFVWWGASAWVILALLAATSPRWVARRLGARRWKALHRGVYLAAPLAVWHAAQAVKGNVLTLQGDITRPVTVGLLVALLLLARLVRRVGKRLPLRRVPPHPPAPETGGRP